MNMLLVY